MAEDFRPAHRLRRRREFVHVYERGTRVHGRLMSIYTAPNGLDGGRLGVTASRKFGKAVVRNAAKRRIRELFRRHQAHAAGLDLVVIPRAALLESSFAACESEYGSLLLRARRRGRG